MSTNIIYGETFLEILEKYIESKMLNGDVIKIRRDMVPFMVFCKTENNMLAHRNFQMSFVEWLHENIGSWEIIPISVGFHACYVAEQDLPLMILKWA